MPRILFDNQPVEVPPGATVLQAARQLGVSIPTLCFQEGLAAETSCMVCVVKVNGSPRLVPSCATQVDEGMVVESETEEVWAARRMALELLLGDHLGDCVGPCQSTCPAHMDIPTMIRQIAAGQMSEAIATVKEHIALPATLGRICAAMCERGCRRSQADQAVSIRLLKRYVADVDLESGEPYRPNCVPPTGRRVALVGAGPTGLAAAWHLLQQGVACTLYDDHPDLGGGLRYGVEEERLPRTVLDAEIATITRLGAELALGVRVGVDRALEELRRQYDAVLIAAGEMSPEAVEALGLRAGARGVEIKAASHETSLEGVFAAGSSVHPSRHAVRAVAGGRSAALAIAAFLAGKPPATAKAPFTVHMGRLTPEELRAFRAGASQAGRVIPTGGELSGFTASEAISEAERCLHCDCLGLRDCRLRLWAEAYGAKPRRFADRRRSYERVLSHPEVVFEPGKCIACGLCVQITRRAKEELGLTFIGRGFTVRTGVPFGENLAAALRRTAAECAAACPTAALTLRPEARLRRAGSGATVEGPKV